MGPLAVTTLRFRPLINRLERHRLAAASFLVAAAFVPGIFSSGSMPRWWAIAIALPLASALDPRELHRGVAALLAAGLGWASVTLLWTPIPAEAALDLAEMALLALAMIAFAGADDLDGPVEGFGWGVALSAPLCAAQWLGHPLAWVPTSGPGGFFMNSEVLAETAAPVAVWALLKRRWALLGAMIVPLALCQSRVAVFAASLALLWAWRGRPRAKIALLLGLAAVAAGTLVALGVPKASTGLTRIVLWATGAQWVSVPGQGLGWWSVAFPGPFETYAHSDPLQIAIELGVAGALPLLAVPVFIFWRGQGDDAARATFACLLVEAAVSFPMRTAATAYLGAALAGWMARRRAHVRRGEPVGGENPVDDAARRGEASGGVLRGRAVDA